MNLGVICTKVAPWRNEVNEEKDGSARMHTRDEVLVSYVATAAAAAAAAAAVAAVAAAAAAVAAVAAAAVAAAAVAVAAAAAAVEIGGGWVGFKPRWCSLMDPPPLSISLGLKLWSRSPSRDPLDQSKKKKEPVKHHESEKK